MHVFSKAVGGNKIIYRCLISLRGAGGGKMDLERQYTAHRAERYLDSELI